jgi:hypothetical protein
VALSYSTLIAAKTVDGSIKNWVNHSILPSTTIVSEAQAWIYARLRVREMRMSGTVSLAIGDYSDALPAGFLDPISLKFDGDGAPIDLVTEDHLGRYIETDGTVQSGWPSRYAIFDEAFQFDSAADETMTGRLLYFGTPDELAASTNETNFLTARYPTLLRQACLAFAYESMKQADQQTYWISQAEKSMNEIPLFDDLSRRGTSYRNET